MARLMSAYFLPLVLKTVSPQTEYSVYKLEAELLSVLGFVPRLVFWTEIAR